MTGPGFSMEVTFVVQHHVKGDCRTSARQRGKNPAGRHVRRIVRGCCTAVLQQLIAERPVLHAGAAEESSKIRACFYSTLLSMDCMAALLHIPSGADWQPGQQ